MKRKLSLRRRALFTAATLVVAFAFLEAGTFALYWIESGKMFSYATVEGMQLRTALREVKKERSVDGRVSEQEFQALVAGMHHTPHPYLGYVYTPELNENEFHEFHEGLEISDFGFVDDKQPIQKRADDRVIIGIVGGSVALNFALDGTEALTADLVEHPRFQGREIVYVRMALGGYKQPQQLLAVAYLLSLGAEFDVLINLDGFNEVTLPCISNFPAGVYPFFPRGWQFIGGRALSRGLQRLIGKRVLLESRRVDLAETFLDMPTRYSVTLQFIWWMWDRALTRDVAAVYEELRGYSQEEPQFVVTGPGTAGFAPETLHRRLAEHWKESSIQLSRLCEANGIQYLHFLQPNQYVEGSKPIVGEERERAFQEQGDYAMHVRAGYPHLIAQGAALRAAGVDFHDLTMLFVDHSEPLYVDTCCHLNRRGNEITAHRIAAAILDATDRGAY